MNKCWVELSKRWGNKAKNRSALNSDFGWAEKSFLQGNKNLSWTENKYFQVSIYIIDTKIGRSELGGIHLFFKNPGN